MGYLYFFIALVAGVAKGFCGKKVSLKVSGNRETFIASTFRMAICVVISACILIFMEDYGHIKPQLKLLSICFLSGIGISSFVVLWLISVKNGSYILLNVFNMLGVLVPVVLSRIFFSEQIKITQAVGIMVLFIAVVILCSYNNKIKKKLNFSAVIMLILCGTANGLTDFTQKLFIYELPKIPVSVFNFYTYLFATAILFTCYLVSFVTAKQKVTLKNSKIVIKNTAVYLAVMSVCLFINAFFKTVSAKYLSSAVLYPLNQGLTLICSTIIASTIFKEKLTVKSIIGVFIAIVGVIINVL